MNDKVIIGIPGPWKTREEIVASIAGKCDPKYIFAGNILLDTEEKNHAEMEIYDNDENLLEACSFSGQGKISEEAPHYRLLFKDDFIYKNNEYFGNPFGRWVLEKV